MFACGAPLVLVDALALPKPELLRLALDGLLALATEAQERTASDDRARARNALDALLGGFPPPERGEPRLGAGGASATFLAALARGLAKVLAKYHRADLHVHYAAARLLAVLAREGRNGAKVSRCLGATPDKGGDALAVRVAKGLAGALEQVIGAVADAPPPPEDDLTEERKREARAARAAFATTLALKAAQLLRCAAWAARAPCALAFEARVEIPARGNRRGAFERARSWTIYVKTRVLERGERAFEAGPTATTRVLPRRVGSLHRSTPRACRSC